MDDRTYPPGHALDVASGDSPAGLHRAGFWALLALTLALPFELRRPLLQNRVATVTDLKIVFYLAALLAAASLAPPLLSLIRSIMQRRYETSGYLYRLRQPLALFGALLATFAISSLLSHHAAVGLKWTLDLGLGGLLWLAMPLWLGEGTERKLDLLGLAIVAGAVTSALVGFAQLALGPSFADHFLWFQDKPTVAGPYLRLSGTFAYANIAAMYFELALPFALVGLARALRRTSLIARRGSLTPRRGSLTARTAGRWTAARLWASLGWLAAIDVLLRALLLTASRGAILGLAVGLVAMGLVTRSWRSLRALRHKGRWLLLLAANLGLVAVSVALSSGTLLALRLTSQSDQDWYRATYIGAPPATVTAGQRMIVPITVHNPGPLTWSAAGANAVEAGYHWLLPSGRVATFESPRTRLPADIGPGGSQSVRVQVVAPCSPGRYLLVWDMVQKRVTWFSLKSAAYRTIPVEVGGPGALHAATACTAAAVRRVGAPREAPTALPTALAEPTRQQLWSAALAMIRARPLFGVGPDGYRLSYGTYSRPRRSSWDTRILANNLLLEIGADVGLVGAALFLAFLVAVGRFAVAGLPGRLPLWQVATIGALAAFLGHGLVDYILEAHSIFILFWMLCGLAATATLRRASFSPRRSKGA